MLNLLYSQLSLTRKSSIIPERVVTIKSEEDLKSITEGVGRYEYTRGSEGKIIVDLTHLKGIEETDDKLKVLAGTTWGDAVKKKPEIFGNLDFSVGGSVEYGDAGFGFNEFKFIKDKVEVEAYLNGNKYVGKYKGGIIYAVIVRKENKELVTKNYETTDFDAVYYKIINWFSQGFPPFRDISIFWQGDKFVLNVTYTKPREPLVSKFISDLNEGKLIYEDLSFPHKYRYFGLIDFSRLTELKDNIKKSKRSVIRVSFNKAYFSIYSDSSLNFSGIDLTPQSDILAENKLNGCIMCGKCVDVCPYSEYKGSLVYSPLGFYTLQALGSPIQINCHMCGKCVEVCPAKIDIISDISKNAVYSLEFTPGKKVKELNYKREIVITPISSSLEERLLKALLYFSAKGSIIGVKYLDIDIQDLVKGRVNWKELAKQFLNVSQIITLTPEEFYYLQPLKNYAILDIGYIEDYTLEEIQGNKEELHIPCYLKDYERRIKPSKCSFAFLDIINGTNVKTDLKAKVTLCPFTAKKLNIKTPLDLLIPEVNKASVKLIVSKIKKGIEDSNKILDDSKWYIGIADNLYYEISNNMYTTSLKSLQPQELIILYYSLESLEDFTPEEKKVIEEKILQLLIK